MLLWFLGMHKRRRYFAAVPAADRAAPLSSSDCCEKPRLTSGRFPNQNLQKEVDGTAESSQHQRCAGFGTAEDQQLGGTHFHSHLFRFSAVVDQRKQRDSFGRRIFLSICTGTVCSTFIALLLFRCAGRGAAT
jgi:hypothetical protein